MFKAYLPVYLRQCFVMNSNLFGTFPKRRRVLDNSHHHRLSYTQIPIVGYAFPKSNRKWAIGIAVYFLGAKYYTDHKKLIDIFYFNSNFYRKHFFLRCMVILTKFALQKYCPILYIEQTMRLQCTFVKYDVYYLLYNLISLLKKNSYAILTNFMPLAFVILLKVRHSCR